MAFKKRSYRKRVPKRTYRKRVAGGKKPSVSAGVKKYVKKVIHSSIENKCVQISSGFNFGNVLESTDLNAYPMCPNSVYWTINQGSGQGNRIGNVVKVRKIYLSYVLRPLPYDVTVNPFPVPTEIQLFLGYVKNFPSSNIAPADINQLFQAGSTSSAPIGGLQDLVSIVNKDYWVIKKKWSHKLGYASYNGTGSLPGQQFNSSNDFKLNVVKRIDITKFCPSTINFNDSSATPTTRNLFFMQQAIWANGGNSGATVQSANIQFWVDFVYEDA